MKKNVLFVNDLVSGGGAEQVMSDLVNFLYQQNQYHITIHAKDVNNEFYNLFPSDVKFVPAFWTGKFPFGSNKYVIRLFNRARNLIFVLSLFRKKLSKDNYDILIAMKEGYPTKIVAELNAPIKLSWIHTDYSYVYGTKGIFKSAQNEINYLQHFDHVICVSEATRRSVIKVIGDPGNLSMKYNPINSKKILEQADEENVSRPKDKLLFVTVGRLSKEKGFDRLLEACRSLAMKNFELWIIGDGPERESLANLKEKYSLNNVHFFGNQSNPYKFMKVADWFICCSRFESFGIAIQEALVLGIPVISTDFSVIREVFSAEFGMVVPNSTIGVHEGLLKALSDTSIRDEFHKNIRKGFDQDTYSKRLKSIAELLIKA